MKIFNILNKSQYTVPLGKRINARKSMKGRKSRPRGNAKNETIFEKNIKKFKLRRA